MLYISNVNQFESLKKIRNNKKIIFTNGCFDLIHIGHIHYLNQAKQLGDILVIGLNSDSSIKKIKGQSRPIQNQNDRAEILLNLKMVDHVFIFEEDNPLNLIQKIKPDFLVKGGDWPINKIIGYDFVTSYGGKVISLSYINNKSSSDIIKKIKDLTN